MAVSPCTTPELQDLLPFRCSNTQIQALETPTHHHLFFECGFSETIWAYFAAKVWPNPPLDLHSAAAWINMARNNFSPQARCIIKLVFQSSIYLIWKERNLRIFTSTSSTTNTVHSAVDRKIRDQLLSIQPSPRIQPSFLQFFFACTRPL
ncbi:BnaC03g48910D [Brassica napus]|uniref:BnaC03g48910D protein n=1 Tax=Brassica napus TaxID=3708 RepID=A0A078FQI0_BRANA|nr:BnaC03g48910D [Brassica napus]